MSFQPVKNKRIDEPSTWAGAASVLLGIVLTSQGFGEGVQQAATEIVGGVAAVVSGVLAIFKREKGDS